MHCILLILDGHLRYRVCLLTMKSLNLYRSTSIVALAPCIADYLLTMKSLSLLGSTPLVALAPHIAPWYFSCSSCCTPHCSWRDTLSECSGAESAFTFWLSCVHSLVFLSCCLLRLTIPNSVSTSYDRSSSLFCTIPLFHVLSPRVIGVT